MGYTAVNPTSIGEATKKSHYDIVFDNTVFNYIPSGTIMIFGQTLAPTGWTKKVDWQDNAMLCYATGAIGSGGSVNPQATHTHTGPSHNHKWYQDLGGSAHDQTFDSNGDALNIVLNTDHDASKYFIASEGDGSDCPVASSGTLYTNKNGTGASGANTAPYYQEVIAAVKD